jgi:hypothetical protein
MNLTKMASWLMDVYYQKVMSAFMISFVFYTKPLKTAIKLIITYQG